jgi:hypothetical protein
MASAKREAQPANWFARQINDVEAKYRTFIFFSSGLASVSPTVGLWWPGKVINLFKQLPAEKLILAGVPQDNCADFIAACSALEKVRHQQPIMVSNLPLRWEGQELLTAAYDTPEKAVQWRA